MHLSSPMTVSVLKPIFTPKPESFADDRSLSCEPTLHALNVCSQHKGMMVSSMLDRRTACNAGPSPPRDMVGVIHKAAMQLPAL